MFKLFIPLITLFFDPAIAKVCTTKKFVSVAGARIRESAKSDSKIVSILHFNDAVCIIKSSEKGFVQIELAENPEINGFLPKNFLTDKTVPLSETMTLSKKFLAESKFNEAVTWAERSVEISQNEETLTLLESALRKVGQIDRAKQISTMLDSSGSPEIVKINGTDTYAGNSFADNSTWRYVECQKLKCHVKTTTLKITSEKVVGYGDTEGEPAQKISAIGTEKALFLFKGVKGAKLGEVKTYYDPSIGHPPRPATNGDYEIELKGVEGGDFKIIGRLRNDKDVVYYLHQGTKKQALDPIAQEDIVGTPGIPNGNQVLVWAGDLDHDSKLDLVLTLTARYGEEINLNLFLSSQAIGEDLVGPPIKFVYWPPENPGC